MKTKRRTQFLDPKKLQQDVLAWYRKHGRKTLPWRNTRDAYHIYLSEVMLQQTQVKTVLERYYFPFLEAFPTLESLAKAPEEAVLKAWEGLGYYRRAKYVHAAAKATVGEHKGALPKTVEALMGLPGIGRNTAHAVACFAYGAAVPVLEANVKRVLARVLAWEALPAEKAMFEAAQTLVPTKPKQAFDYNQAMMDIGASLCTPKKPQCLICPLEPHCAGKGAPEQYPAPKPKAAKKKVPQRHQTVLVLEHAGAWAMRPRDTKLLGGLWQFVELEQGAKKWEGIPIRKPQFLVEIRHVYSHFERVASVHHIPLSTRPNLPDGWQWVTQDECASLPQSGFEKKVIAKIKG